MPRILLIADTPSAGASTIEEHISGIVRNSQYEIHQHRSRNAFPGNLSEFDLIIIHYTLIAYPFRNDNMISSELRYQLVESNLPKIAIVQDDYRAIYERIRFFNFIGIRHVLTLGNSQVREIIYPTNLCNFTKSQILTGYNDGSYGNWPSKQWKNRTIDIGYRARRLPPWMGELGTFKSEVIELVKSHPTINNLKLDMSCSEESRLYGSDWIDFLCNVKIALGTESGSSTLDFDGRFSDKWTLSQSKFPTTMVEPIQCDYGVSSPRVFEYAAAKCLMALTDGEYSGIIRPWEHYYPLKKDLSNFQDLLDFSKNGLERDAMINRAFTHLVESPRYSYSTLADEIDKQISKLIDVSPLALNNSKLTAALPTVQSVLTDDNHSTKELVVNFLKVIYFKIKPKVLRLILRKTFFYLFDKFKNNSRRVVFYLRNLIQINAICKSTNLKVALPFRFILALDFEDFSRFIQHAHMNGILLVQRIENDVHFLEWNQSDFLGDKLTDFPKITFYSYREESGFYISRGLYSQGAPPQRLRNFSLFKKFSKITFDRFLKLALQNI